MKVIFDIDGTIADCTHRLHLIDGKDKKWDEFHKACVDDKPIPNIIKLIGMVVETHNADDIFFCTGRPESSREQTEIWLSENTPAICACSDMITTFCNRPCVNCNEYNLQILMRKDGDYRPDIIVKPELLMKAGLTPDKVMFIVEDRAKVVNRYRELGYTVLQCAHGDY